MNKHKNIKWTYDTCEAELLKYNSISEIKNKWIYKVILKNGWYILLDNIRIQKKNGHWLDYDTCKEEALKFKNRLEFSQKSGSAYHVVNKKGWFELLEHMTPVKKWTYDKCKKEAKLYTHKSEFKTHNNGAYSAIISNKWHELMEHLINKKRPSNYWTYDRCVEEVSKFKSKKDFRKSSKAYATIIKNKWNEIMEGLYSEVHDLWTYDTCKKVASEFNNISEFRKKYGGAYAKIRLNSWDELFNHMYSLGHKYKRLIYVYEFDDNNCYVGLTCNINRRNKQHLKHDNKSCVYKHMHETNLSPKLILKSDYIDVKEAVLLEEKTLNDYKQNGWNTLNRVKCGSIGGNSLKWDFDSCEKEVKKYKMLKEFKKLSAGACNSVYKNGWYIQLFGENFEGYKKKK